MQYTETLTRTSTGQTVPCFPPSAQTPSAGSVRGYAHSSNYATPPNQRANPGIGSSPGGGGGGVGGIIVGVFIFAVLGLVLKNGCNSGPSTPYSGSNVVTSGAPAPASFGSASAPQNYSPSSQQGQFAPTPRYYTSNVSSSGLPLDTVVPAWDGARVRMEGGEIRVDLPDGRQIIVNDPYSPHSPIRGPPYTLYQRPLIPGDIPPDGVGIPGSSATPRGGLNPYGQGKM
jgi:hypothetical protein